MAYVICCGLWHTEDFEGAGIPSPADQLISWLQCTVRDGGTGRYLLIQCPGLTRSILASTALWNCRADTGTYSTVQMDSHPAFDHEKLTVRRQKLLSLSPEVLRQDHFF
jgi:hypothetical protein